MTAEAVRAWLEARYDEDEQHADQVHDVGCAMVLDGALNRSCDCGVPDRIRREVEATRRILNLHEGGHECSVYRRGTDWDGEPYEDIDSCSYVLDDEHCSTVRLVALRYSDRTDFPAELRLP